MKTKLFFLLLIFTCADSLAQIFQEYEIHTYPNNLVSFNIGADLDGDGDIDIVAASYDSANGTPDNNKIVWYENTDGQGNFGVERIITTNELGIIRIHAADIDGDGDLDLITGTYDDIKIAWLENIDGQGNFGSEQIITTNVDRVAKISTSDIDGDGDTDVLSASYEDDKIAWYENLDGQGNFGAQRIISTITDRAFVVFPIDIDGDGDIDILSASSDDDKIAWYENIDGQGNFGTQEIISSIAGGANDVYAGDIDQDGDIDVLSTSYYDDKIAWYENIDSHGNFGSEQVISNNEEWVNSVTAVDIDGDNDLDILFSSLFYSEIAWKENLDGLGSFGPRLLITSNAEWVESALLTDINGDGKMDVLWSTTNSDKISWFENSNSLSVDKNSIPAVTIYPVPTSGKLHIKSLSKFKGIEIYDPLGQLVFSNSGQERIDISELNRGIYFLIAIDKNGNFEPKKVIKN